jgi:hypothetical protein
MSRFFRASVSQDVSTLELVVEIPDHLYAYYENLNEIASRTVAQRWRELHPNQDDPPRLPQHFKIEGLSDFDPGSVALGFGPFEFPGGTRVWITKPIPSLFIPN